MKKYLKFFLVVSGLFMATVGLAEVTETEVIIKATKTEMTPSSLRCLNTGSHLICVVCYESGECNMGIWPL